MLAVKDIHVVRDYILQMKFKPMPRFTQGVVQGALGRDAGADQIGRMFIQPRIEREDGRVHRLDEALGSGFALLTWQRNLMGEASGGLRALLKRMGCRSVAAARGRSLQGMQLRAAAVPDCEAIEDNENLLHFWFQRTGVDWVLLRPDRYVAALGPAAELESRLQAFGQRFLPA